MGNQLLVLQNLGCLLNTAGRQEMVTLDKLHASNPTRLTLAADSYQQIALPYRQLEQRVLVGFQIDEELANMAICLCHQIDRALTKYIEQKDREFTTEGGIRERMTAARLEQRATQKEVIERQAREIASLRQEVARLRELLGLSDEGK